MSVTSIGDHAFFRCIGLTKVCFGGTEEQWKWSAYFPSNVIMSYAEEPVALMMVSDDDAVADSDAVSEGDVVSDHDTTSGNDAPVILSEDGVEGEAATLEDAAAVRATIFNNECYGI